MDLPVPQILFLWVFSLNYLRTKNARPRDISCRETAHLEESVFNDSLYDVADVLVAGRKGIDRVVELEAV